MSTCSLLPWRLQPTSRLPPASPVRLLAHPVITHTLQPHTSPGRIFETAMESSTTEDTFQKLSLQNQQTSPLLRLPAELRNKIYEYVFGGEHLLVYTQNKRRLVRQKDPTRPLSRDLPEYPALTAVSRQLNTETKHMVFSHNTFGTFSECLLLSFRSVFQPWQVNCITTLHVTVSDLTIWGWEYTGGWVHSAKKVRDILMMFPGLECLVFELAVPFAGNTRLPASRVWPLWSRLLHYTQRALKDQDGSVRFVATVSRIDWEAAE